MSEDRLIGTSIRLPRWLLDRLNEEAKSRRMSFNALATKGLTKYVMFDLFIEKAHPVTLAQKSLTPIIRRLEPHEQEEAGKEPGAEVISSLFTLYNITPSLDSILKFHFEPMSEYSGWYSMKYYGAEQKIVLHHDMGIGWSYFLKGHTEASIYSTLKFVPRINMTKSSVIIHFK